MIKGQVLSLSLFYTHMCSITPRFSISGHIQKPESRIQISVNLSGLYTVTNSLRALRVSVLILLQTFGVTLVIFSGMFLTPYIIRFLLYRFFPNILLRRSRRSNLYNTDRRELKIQKILLYIFCLSYARPQLLLAFYKLLNKL